MQVDATWKSTTVSIAQPAIGRLAALAGATTALVPVADADADATAAWGLSGGPSGRV